MAFTQRFFYQLFNNKRAGWLIITIATIAKSLLVAAFSNYETDKSFYLLLGKNLSAGKGFTIPVTLLSNPGVTENIYIPAASSPLYSIIAAPILKLFPDNYFLVTWLIESVSWLLLFIILRKILLLLTENHFWTNLYILFAGFFLYTVEISSSSKDVLALALVFWGLHRCIKIGSAGSRPSIDYIIATALVFFLPGLMKITYMPLLIVFPLSLLFIGFLKNEKRLLRYGYITLFACIILAAIHYFYFHSLEKQTLALYPDFYSQRWSMAKSGNEYISGFFPENLVKLYPFIPASVINLDFLGVQVRSHFFSAYQLYAYLLHGFNFIALVFFMIAFFYFSKKYYRKSISDRIFFLIAGMFLSLAIITALSAMSLRYHAIEYKGSDASWTFVYESRSFLVPIIFLQLVIFIFIFSNKQSSIITQILKTILLAIVSISFIHGVYFVAKRSVSYFTGENKSPSINRLVTDIADSTKRSNPDHNVWIATEMSHLDWYAKLNKQKLLNNLSFLNVDSFQLPPKTILLMALPKEDTMNLRIYMNRPDVTLIRNYDNAYFVFRQEALPE